MWCCHVDRHGAQKAEGRVGRTWTSSSTPRKSAVSASGSLASAASGKARGFHDGGSGTIAVDKQMNAVLLVVYPPTALPARPFSRWVVTAAEVDV